MADLVRSALRTAGTFAVYVGRTFQVRQAVSKKVRVMPDTMTEFSMMLVPALAVFFLSGVAALLYQVVWQRMLAIFSGTDVYSFTIIVAAFMAGLGIGHLGGGYLADRCSRRTNILLFAASELAIALFSFFSRGLYYDVLYQRLGPLSIAPTIIALILFVSLLWPTFFMGMSLPLLAKALTRNLERAASTVGALYGVNTLGAAAGALAATWWMLPRFGLDGSLRIGGMLNLICVAVVLPFVWPLGSERSERSERFERSERSEAIRTI